MFNKSLFNRNAFDRSVSLPSISAAMSSAGTMRLQPVLAFPLTIRPIAGIGSMKCGIVMQQHIGLTMIGEGELTDVVVNLILPLRPVNFTGSGTLKPEITVVTPFRASITSSGTMAISNRMYFIQQIQAHIASHGMFKPDFVMLSSIDPIVFAGTSDLKGKVSLHLPIPTDFVGTGEMILRRLSAMNENVLELIDINIQPGETIIIDTDLLQVLIGSKEDVSSITSDSVFFELNPGENEITVSTDSDTTLDVVAIWQNRWL